MSVNTPRANDQQGMTLVEVMIALVIIGFVFTALASVLATSMRSVRGQESMTQATGAINDILEEAQRVEYDEAVLCSTEATAAFGATAFEGEDLVVSPHVCSEPDRVRAERQVDRDGRTYEVRTAITWADDDGDGTGAADVDSTQDIKRVVVDVSWTTDGRTRTARNMAYRAPQYLEQMVVAEVVADDGSNFISITDDAVDDGENDEDFTLRAFAGQKLQKVQVSWVDRTGFVESHPMKEQADDVWEHSLGSNFGPFANGGTVFTFAATAANGDTETVTARGLFLYDLLAPLPGPSSRVIQNSFVYTPDNHPILRISKADGAACPGQAMWIDVEGTVRSDLATATWLKGPAGQETLASVTAPDEVALRGARFEIDLSGRTDFATANADGTYSVPNGTVQIRIRIDRIVDDATLAREQDNIQVQLVESCA